MARCAFRKLSDWCWCELICNTYGKSLGDRQRPANVACMPQRISSNKSCRTYVLVAQVDGLASTPDSVSFGGGQLAGPPIDCRIHFLLPEELGEPACIPMPRDSTICDLLQKIEHLTDVGPPDLPILQQHIEH